MWPTEGAEWVQKLYLDVIFELDYFATAFTCFSLVYMRFTFKNCFCFIFPISLPIGYGISSLYY